MEEEWEESKVKEKPSHRMLEVEATATLTRGQRSAFAEHNRGYCNAEVSTLYSSWGGLRRGREANRGLVMERCNRKKHGEACNRSDSATAATSLPPANRSYCRCNKHGRRTARLQRRERSQFLQRMTGTCFRRYYIRLLGITLRRLDDTTAGQQPSTTMATHDHGDRSHDYADCDAAYHT